MNATCPDCRTVYRVDPRKVPAGGVFARCARCLAEFAVYSPSESVPDTLVAHAVADSAAVGVAAVGQMEDLEPTVAEEIGVPQPAAEGVASDVVAAEASPEWIEPTVAEAAKAPTVEGDRSWLLRGSAWVDEISARVDEPAAAAVEASGEGAPTDLDGAAAGAGHDAGSISVAIDFNPEASGFADSNAASEGQDASGEQEALPAEVTAGLDSVEAGLGAYADGDQGPEIAELQYEAGEGEAGGASAYVTSDVGGEGAVAEYAGSADAPDGDAVAHESGAHAIEPGADDFGTEVPVTAGTAYSPYEGSTSYEGGSSEYGDGSHASSIEGAGEAFAHEPAAYDAAVQGGGEEAATSRGSGEEAAEEFARAGATTCDSGGHGLAEDASGGYEGDYEGREVESEHAVGASADYTSDYSTSDAQERVEVEVGAVTGASSGVGGESQQYAAVSSADPVMQEPSPSDSWGGAQPETPPAEEPPPAPTGGARDREAVVVSANASSIDAVVAGTSDGEGFTAVPPRSDEDIPLPPSPFGLSDPHARAKRLARALVSDIVVYNPDRRERSIRMGTVRQEFREEIRKSWEEYVAHVGNQMARETTYFRDALNELLAGGQRLF